MSTNGRKSNGRFGKGNKGGPGRPPRDIEADYLATLSDTAPADYRAREWFGKYLADDAPAVSVTLVTEPGFRILEHDDWYGNADRLEE